MAWGGGFLYPHTTMLWNFHIETVWLMARYCLCTACVNGLRVLVTCVWAVCPTVDGRFLVNGRAQVLVDGFTTGSDVCG